MSKYTIYYTCEVDGIRAELAEYADTYKEADEIRAALKADDNCFNISIVNTEVDY